MMNVFVFDALGLGLGMMLQSMDLIKLYINLFLNYAFNIMHTLFNYLAIKYFTGFLFISRYVVINNDGDCCFLFIVIINIVILVCV